MRIRYWHLNIPDLLSARYPLEKINHWEIKCLQGDYQHFGVFWYKYGTPYDKEPVHGICSYYNEIPDKMVKELVEYLKTKFNGEVLFRQTRFFLQGSKIIVEPRAIGELANDVSLKFNGPVEITIEFEKVEQSEIDENMFNLPANKLLSIPGPD